MGKQNETGHTKNAANFRIIIAACRGYGIIYDPPRTALTLPELVIQADRADASLDALRTAVQAEKDATNLREIPFKELSKLSTRIINGLAAFGSPQNVIDDARFLLNKLAGRRATKIDPAMIAAGATINSVSQMSYDMRVDSFEKLVKLVENQPSYNPNEVGMQKATLKAFSQNLITLNRNVVNARVATEIARITRDKVLYTDANSIYNLTTDIKKYAKYLYGANGAEYKQISSITVTSTPKKL